MKARFFLTLVGVGALSLVLGLYAQEPKTPPSEVGKFKDEAALQEQILLRRFVDFQQQVLKLMQRLERSPRKEDKDRAEVLRKVLDKAQFASISTQFEKMVDFLKTNKLSGSSEIKLAAEDAKKLADSLGELVAILREDGRIQKLNSEEKRLKELIKEIEKVIIQQKQVQGQTDIGKTDPKELKGNQNQVTEATAKIAKAIDAKDGQGGDAKNAKGAPKEGGKNEGKKGEAKDVGKDSESKKAESKEGKEGKEGKAGEAKSGDSKPGKGKEGEPSEATAKEGKGGEAKEGGAKGSKGGAEPKGNPKGGAGKEGDKKEGPEAVAKNEGDQKGPREKTAEAKGTEKKPGDKEGEAKSGQKGAEGKEATAKNSKDSGKQGDPKGGGDPKQGEAKPGDKSQGQGQAKAGGQPKEGGPQPSPKGGGEPPPPSSPKAGGDDQIAKKQVQDAEYKQKQAEEKIAEKDNKEASNKQGQAIKDLEAAKKKLEDLLRQIREEELERLLAALQSRCERMLEMQIAVLNGTESVYKAVQANADQKPNRDNQGESIKLSDREKEIVAEATKAIQMLEAEGSAVAFPEVFQQVREDMKHVQRRLDVTDVGIVTQAIEKDIIDTLKEMIDALKKAQKDMQDKKNPPPGDPKAGGPPQDQKLLEMIAELKMIRSLQLRVNARTQVYGKMYQGEQAAEVTIRRELDNLSQRQERIYEVTHKISKGDNK